MKRGILSISLFLALPVLPGAELHGQADGSGDSTADWQAAALYRHESLQEQRDWRSLTLLAGRAFQTRTLILELQITEREGLRESAFGADLYQDLPTGGYLYLRGHVAPGAEALPSLLAGMNLFHPLTAGWEGWIGYEHRTYPSSTVHTFGVGPGLYVPRWYLRGQASVSLAGGETTRVGKLLARRLIHDSPVDYIELGAGFGSEFVELVPTATSRVEIDAQDTWILSVRAQRFLTRGVGLTAGGVYQSYEGLGARPSLTVGVLGRW